jgi:glycosyltransferase involved in cell wall biosynthesis
VSNTTYLGSVSAHDVAGVLKRSIALVNTSFAEGFPNTFLEAWWHRRPVVSLRVDPGGVLSRNGAGYCAAGSLESLAGRIRQLAADPAAAAAVGQRGYTYLCEHHLGAAAGSRLLTAVDDAVALARRPPAEVVDAM